jgi:pyruvate formate lyase activating enzyme
VLDLCRGESIHTNIETSGLFALERWRPILPKLDLIFFDLKLMIPEQHGEQLGTGYETIRSNALALAEMELPVEFRMPVIPGFTDTDANLEAVTRLLQEMKQQGIHLLPYHNMGEAKIDAIQGAQPRLGLPGLSQERMRSVQTSFRERGFSILNPV